MSFREELVRDWRRDRNKPGTHYCFFKRVLGCLLYVSCVRSEQVFSKDIHKLGSKTVFRDGTLSLKAFWAPNSDYANHSSCLCGHQEQSLNITSLNLNKLGPKNAESRKKRHFVFICSQM